MSFSQEKLLSPDAAEQGQSARASQIFGQSTQLFLLEWRLKIFEGWEAVSSGITDFEHSFLLLACDHQNMRCYVFRVNCFSKSVACNLISDLVVMEKNKKPKQTSCHFNCWNICSMNEIALSRMRLKHSILKLSCEL